MIFYENRIWEEENAVIYRPIDLYDLYLVWIPAQV